MFGVAQPPTSITSIPVLPKHIFGQAFIGFSGINYNNFLDFLAATLVFLFVNVFDTIGTVAGVGKQAGYINERGELPRANSALMSDAVATMTGSVLGVSTIAVYVESAAGVSEGERTGFPAAVVSGLFFVSLLFTPIFAAIPAFATAPALVVIGVIMMGSIANIRWDDFTESLPAFMTIFFIPYYCSNHSNL